MPINRHELSAFAGAATGVGVGVVWVVGLFVGWLVIVGAVVVGVDVGVAIVWDW